MVLRTMMFKQAKVLAITKRTAELCATQSLLYAAGLQLVTATNINAACSVINGMRVRAVIVCRNSWSEEERQSIVSQLAALCPELPVLMHCPGCTGCDEAAGRAGRLSDALPLTQLLSAIASTTKS